MGSPCSHLVSLCNWPFSEVKLRLSQTLSSNPRAGFSVARNLIDLKKFPTSYPGLSKTFLMCWSWPRLLRKQVNESNRISKGCIDTALVLISKKYLFAYLLCNLFYVLCVLAITISKILLDAFSCLFLQVFCWRVCSVVVAALVPSRLCGWW